MSSAKYLLKNRLLKRLKTIHVLCKDEDQKMTRNDWQLFWHSLTHANEQNRREKFASLTKSRLMEKTE